MVMSADACFIPHVHFRDDSVTDLRFEDPVGKLIM